MISKNLFIVFLLASSVSSSGQAYLLPNEELVFSFDTQNGKKVSLNKDRNNKYIIYRFGTKDKIEFEFPGKSKKSWTNFTYSFYLRGGGTQNEGMDLNYIYFVNKNYKYVIYYTYYAVGGKPDVGIKIINLTSNKITNMKGNIKTLKGTLVDFRDNKLLEIGDELFD